LLADHGYRILGVDPGWQHIFFATQTLKPRNNMAFSILGLQDLLSYRKKFNAFFDNCIATEILQFFPDLDKFFLGCRRLLRPGGMLIINDFATIPVLAWEKVPYHKRGSIRVAAEAAGLIVTEQREITAQVAPTLDRLIEGMNGLSGSKLTRFHNAYPNVDAAMQEQIFQWEQLRAGFMLGDLVYETTVCRLPGDRPADE